MARNGREPDLYTTVSDELFADLTELTGERVAHVVLWEESLADELEGVSVGAEAQATFDLDLYLVDGVYLELYGVTCFRDPDEDPLQGWEETGRALLALVNQGVWLDEIAVDEEDQLVLILAQQRQPALYLVVSGWLVEEWDELPA